MYVYLMIDKRMVHPSESCLMITAPSLLAEPSRPSATEGRFERNRPELKTLSDPKFQDVAPGRFGGDLLNAPGHRGIRRDLTPEEVLVWSPLVGQTNRL